MNFSSFSPTQSLRRFIVALLLIAAACCLQAQTISGYVFDECTGSGLEGAIIRISFNFNGSPPGGWSIPTYPDGSWNFSFFSSDPDGPYYISVSGGAASPTFYTYFRNQGNQSNFNFNLLPKNWSFTINGEAVSWQNNPQSPHILCQNQDNCLQLTGLNGEAFVPQAQHCFQIRHYVPDPHSGNPGQLLASSQCQNFARPQPNEPCGDQAFDINALLQGLPTIPPLIRLELWHFCCNQQCSPAETGLLNKEVVFVEVKNIGPAQACFMFEDPDGINLIMPGEDCENAVAYCQVDVEVDGTCSSGVIDQYWISVTEYDYNTCDFIRILADGVSNPTSINSLNDLDGINLNNYVRDHWVVDSNPIWPYFYLTNFPNNYEVTLFVKNECGVYSKSGWFDNSIQCLNQNQNGEKTQIYSQPMSKKIKQKESSLKIDVSPNPISDISFIRFQLPSDSKVLVKINNILGENLKSIALGVFSKGINELPIDLSELPSGRYMLIFSTDTELKTQMIVKY